MGSLLAALTLPLCIPHSNTMPSPSCCRACVGADQSGLPSWRHGAADLHASEAAPRDRGDGLQVQLAGEELGEGGQRQEQRPAQEAHVEQSQVCWFRVSLPPCLPRSVMHSMHSQPTSVFTPAAAAFSSTSLCAHRGRPTQSTPSTPTPSPTTRSSACAAVR